MRNPRYSRLSLIDGGVILVIHKERQRLNATLEEVEETLEGLRKIGVLQDFMLWKGLMRRQIVGGLTGLSGCDFSG